MITDEQRGQISRYSSDIERRLKERLGAEGKGIRELADSVQTQLTDEIYHHIRFIARDRNAAVHGDADKSIDMNRYIDRCESVILLLEKLEKNEAVESLPEWSAKCLFCGRVISKKAEQCPSCKQVNPVYSRMQTCVDCGTAYRYEHEVCPKCGRPKPPKPPTQFQHFCATLWGFCVALWWLCAKFIALLFIIFYGLFGVFWLVGGEEIETPLQDLILIFMLLFSACVSWIISWKSWKKFWKSRKK